MTQPDQLEMFAGGLTEEDQYRFVSLLRMNGWLTRRTLCQLLGWPERKIRAVAEAAGAAVVRGPRGFNCFEKCSLDEVDHCAAIAESQATKMLNYSLALRRRAHGRIA